MENLRVTWRTMQLEEGRMMAAYAIHRNDTLHLLWRLKGGAGSASSPAAAAPQVHLASGHASSMVPGLVLYPHP